MNLIIPPSHHQHPEFATAPSSGTDENVLLSSWPRTEDVAYTAASSIVIATGSMSASGYGLTTEMNA
ncbi:hypothetical protein, partial [Corynebacterium suicordis]|uniref:hypothetical protein n=1 Tax=Corynebacterium suicordis TaxID=203264 RepID=UPI001E4CCCF4